MRPCRPRSHDKYGLRGHAQRTADPERSACTSRCGGTGCLQCAHRASERTATACAQPPVLTGALGRFSSRRLVCALRPPPRLPTSPPHARLEAFFGRCLEDELEDELRRGAFFFGGFLAPSPAKAAAEREGDEPFEPGWAALDLRRDDGLDGGGEREAAPAALPPPDLDAEATDPLLPRLLLRPRLLLPLRPLLRPLVLQASIA